MDIWIVKIDSVIRWERCRMRGLLFDEQLRVGYLCGMVEVLGWGVAKVARFV